jgi:hypothetical protein
MKTFVLAAVALSPAALSAQVLYSTALSEPVPARAPLSGDREGPVAPPVTAFVAGLSPTPPRIDYKLRVRPPPAGMDFKILVGRPDDRYKYKLLMPRPDARAQPRWPTAPRR